MESNELRESFLKNWERFLTELKGSMLSAADKQPFNSSLASQILADTLFEWKSESNLIGKWLDNLKQSDRKKYEKVAEILFKQVKFEDVKLEPSNQEKILPFVPYGVSVAALGTTCLLHTSIWWKIAAVVVPPVVLKKPIDNLIDELQLQNAKDSIPKYISQLDKYKDVILAFLS